MIEVSVPFCHVFYYLFHKFMPVFLCVSREFNKQALSTILTGLEQPKQVRSSAQPKWLNFPSVACRYISQVLNAEQ